MLNAVPNLFLVGVPKAGTTSLAKWLTDHPQIRGGRTKELRYLMDESDPLADPKGYCRNGLNGYAKHFPHIENGTKLRLDASPQYYYQTVALDVIPRLADAHVAFVLRDPAERIYSLYRYALNNVAVLPEGMTFPEFVDHARSPDESDVFRNKPMLRNAIAHGEYARYVLQWFEAMGRDRVSVLLMDDLLEQPGHSLRTLCSTLGIDANFYDSYAFPRENESYRVRNRRLHKASRNMRKYIPGVLRKAIAPVYGRLNTSKPSFGKSPDDVACLERLRDDFRAHNEELMSLLGRPNILWQMRTAVG